MHIVHLTWSLQLGGLETMLVNIINEQVLQEQVSLIIINESFDSTLIQKIDKRINVIFLHRQLQSKNLWYYIKLNLILIVLKADIIHCHAPRIGIVLNPMFKKKMLWTIHDVGIDSKYFKNFVHFCSISNCVYYDVYKRINIETKVIYNGIRVSDFKQKNKQYIKGNLFKIVQISRLMHEKKGQHILIKAVFLLKKQGIENIYVDFIGEGSSYEYLNNLITQLGLSNQIHLLGAKTNTYLAKHICDYDLAVQPSIFEGFGLTVAECMSAKVPVLISANDGPMEIIDGGKYGYCFTNGDIKDCADKIKLAMSADNTGLVEQAYERVKNCFHISRTASEYIKEYKTIIQK